MSGIDESQAWRKCIVEEQTTGQAMFEGMTTLEPDIVAMEDQTEKLTWVALANLNVKDGQRVESSTAILQATCVDATTIPYVQQKFNMSMRCYGCRDATDIEPGETVLGFPFKDFLKIAGSIEFLSKKPIPNSRGKNALSTLKRKEAKMIGKDDPFENK